MSIAEIQICCERFKDFYEEGEIIYAYDLTNEIDETQWIIDGLALIYDCPFCGKFIKGSGYGNYDEKYPPIDPNKRLYR